MIISKCPLRISLVGGSTDLEEFLDNNEYGSVISFPCNLYTYITLFEDKLGLNNLQKKYVIAYSKREETDNILSIKNNIARIIFKEYNIPPVNCTFNSDIFSSSSGLASSSSYTLSLLKAILKYKNINISNIEICKKALEIERQFNPLTGQQDIYGCGISGFKRMIFKKNQTPIFKYYNTNIFELFDFYLISSGITRSSTKILKKNDINKSKNLIDLVNQADLMIDKGDYSGLINIIKEGWIKKKESNPDIIANTTVNQIDQMLSNNKKIIAHRLCGAGNGGHFLFITKKNQSNIFLNNTLFTKITCDNTGENFTVL